MVIPAQPGWVIRWPDGHGPPEEAIIAWEIPSRQDIIDGLCDPDSIPITKQGRENPDPLWVQQRSEEDWRRLL